MDSDLLSWELGTLGFITPQELGELRFITLRVGKTWVYYPKSFNDFDLLSWELGGFGFITWSIERTLFITQRAEILP